MDYIIPATDNEANHADDTEHRINAQVIARILIAMFCV